ncbi:hypothetical protein [Citrobacter portucalensis]|uniref:hypothetical protein n=1 Tax=Citrobacter portucalensis TaxID=1639133 RepID=UPI0040427187
MSVNYQVRSILGNDETRWITTITGDIIANDDDGEERLAGKVKYYQIHANDAMDNEYRPEDILDLTSNTAHFLGAIFDKGGCYFRRKIQNLFDTEIFNSDLLLVDSIEILPPFRGRNFFYRLLTTGYAVLAARLSSLPPRYFRCNLRSHQKMKSISDGRKKWPTTFFVRIKKDLTPADSLLPENGFYKNIGYRCDGKIYHTTLATNKRERSS